MIFRSYCALHFLSIVQPALEESCHIVSPLERLKCSSEKRLKELADRLAEDLAARGGLTRLRNHAIYAEDQIHPLEDSI